MSPVPTTVADLARFDTLIDARSPAEFAEDHVPGAINLPVLDDEERRIVGTTYKQVSAFEARKIGGAMVARNLARHLETEFMRGRPKQWRPLVYCWRGGLRSGSFVTWLRLVGFDAQQLNGGYKSWRQHVIATIDRLMPLADLRVLGGPTGSAKTRVLQALAAQGAQVLDLESLAGHRGSVLGAVPGIEQPSQKGFETRVVDALGRFDLARPIYAESESRKIGRIALPDAVLHALRRAPRLLIEAPLGERLAYLLEDYAHLGDDRDALAAKLAQLKGLQSNETLARWDDLARTGALAPLFTELMTLHYDPLYARSQLGRDGQSPASVQHLPAPDLTPDGLAALATRILALEKSATVLA
jgi:tRNA 2-selenouridine synthase